MKWIIQFVLKQFAKRSAQKTGVAKLLKETDDIVQLNARNIENTLKSMGINPKNLTSTDDVLKSMNYHKAMMDQSLKQEFKGLGLGKGIKSLEKKDPFQGWTPKIVPKDKTLLKDSPEAIAKIKAENKAAAERLRKKKLDEEPDDLASGGIARVGYFKGKLAKELIGQFTKAEVLIQMLKNTLKGSKDAYVKKTFPKWIKEIQANPSLANNENVWKNLTTGLPKNQRLIVHSDDSVDFFRQTEFGPHNIQRTLDFQKKHNLSRDQANKILRMEPEDRVLEMKRLETIADRNKITKTLGTGEDLSSVSPAYGEKYVDQLLRDWKPGKGRKKQAAGGIAGELHLNRPGYAGGKSTFPKQLSLFARPKIGDALKKLSDAELKKQIRAMARKWGVPVPKASGGRVSLTKGGLAHVLGV